MEKGNPHGPIIEPKLRKLHSKLQELSVDGELFKIIHRPGWTTLIDVYFITQSIDYMHAQAELLQNQLASLTTVSNMILEAGE